MTTMQAEENKVEDKQVSQKKKRNRIIRLSILIYLAVLAALLLIVYAFPKVSGGFSETMTIQYGDLKMSEKLDCYIIRNETVYYAADNGSVGYYFQEGQKARTNSLIITFTPGEVSDPNEYTQYNSRVRRLLGGYGFLTTDEDSSNFIAEEAEGVDVSQSGIRGSYVIPSSGIISYRFDGYEYQLTPANMEKLDRKKVEAIDGELTNFCSGAATAGEPVFKVIDDSQWYAVAWIDESSLGKYTEGASITMNSGDLSVKGRVERVIDNGSDIMVIFRFNTYCESLSMIRKLSAEIVTSDATGLMVENSFIASEDGQPGVYVLGVTGDTTFVPINIKASDGSYSLVSSGYFYRTVGEEKEKVETVSVYDEIKKEK